MNISQFPDLTASNSIDVPNISDTMFGDLKEEKNMKNVLSLYKYQEFVNMYGVLKYEILYDIGYA